MSASVKKAPKGTLVVEGFRHEATALKSESPEVAARLDANPPKLVKTANAHPPDAAHASPDVDPDLLIKGVVFDLPLNHRKIVAGLALALEQQGIDPRDSATLYAEFGVRNFEEFVQKTKQALTLDPEHAVTPSKAVGNFFEAVGWNHPVIRALRKRLIDTYRASANAVVGAKEGMLDGLFEPVTVKSRFGEDVTTMENTRLIVVDADGTVLDGGQWVDRLDHVENQHGQVLGIFGDIKGISASKGLREQVASLPPRLLAARAYGRRVFIEGGVGDKTKRIALSSFVFPEDVDVAALGRLGVKATKGGTKYEFETAKDTYGDPFTRMVLHCRTDKLWRIYAFLYRELGL